MSITTELTTRLGTPILVQLTNFDDPDALTVNTARRDAAVTDGQTLVRTQLGLVEPADTTTDLYTSYVALVVKAVRYFLLWYKEPESSETQAALTEFTDLVTAWRPRQDVPLLTDSVVDMTDIDDTDRAPRLSPDHFDKLRIK